MYYLPDKEDLRLGYEYEEFLPYHNKWEKRVITELSNDKDGGGGFADIEFLINSFPQHVRVSNLTKEQIESEGWELMITEDWVKVSVFNKNDFQYELLFDELKHTITVIKFRKKESSILFSGECLSINEFRMITRKSLKIE